MVIFISRGKGAKDSTQIWRAFTHGMILATIVGLFVGMFSVILRIPLLHIMGAQTNILDQAIPYFTVVIGASPLMAWFTSLGASFRALGDTKTPFRVGIEMNAIHIVLDYLLIFGIGSMVIA
jgi:Na+-driven multidrug efflux pump